MTDAKRAYIEALMVDLRTYQRQFENYMTANRWDEEGIWEADAMRAVGMFLEYVETGRVTGDDGKELEA